MNVELILEGKEIELWKGKFISYDNLDAPVCFSVSWWKKNEVEKCIWKTSNFGQRTILHPYQDVL